jgi:hypothetical protein
MALPWELRRRGLKDSLRHDQRVKEAIHDDASFYGWIGQTAAAPSSLQHALQGITQPHFLSVTISHKVKLFQVLQTFLQPRDKVQV